MKTYTLAITLLITCIVIPADSFARETRNVRLSGNLDALSAIQEVPLDGLTFAELDEAANLSQRVQLFDSVGTAHVLAIYFFHTQESTWFIQTFVDGDEVLGGTAGMPYLLGQASIVFEDSGSRVQPIPDSDFTIAPAWLSGSVQTEIAFSFYDFTQFESDSAVTSVSQDGCVSNCPQNGGLDFDGDTKDDIAIWRPESGMWAIRKSSAETAETIWIQWGLPGDYPMPGDYDGDGIADLAVWRPSNGNWYVCLLRRNHEGCFSTLTEQFGLPGDRPLSGDFDGDGTFDYAVWRPAYGLFVYKGSRTEELIVQQWGLPDDIPLGTRVSQ